MKLALITAISRNGVIGRSDGKLGLPWHLPEDLKRFRKLTTGCPVVMGRVTHEAIGRPLPKRLNVVLTRDANYEAADGVLVAHTLDAALEALSEHPLVFIIGGAQLYAEAWSRCELFYVTEFDREADGDVRFPDVSWDGLTEVARLPALTESDVTFVTWERVARTALKPADVE